MREKKIFIYLVLTWFILLGVYIYLEKTGIKIFQTEKKVQMITMKEAQYKINRLLSNNPIVFANSVSSVSNMENNQSLNSIVGLLKRVESNIFISIASHSDFEGTNSKNRILSQKRAESVLAFITTKYPSNAIDAIGYGEEFPLSQEKNATINRRIEITLHSLPPKI